MILTREVLVAGVRVILIACNLIKTTTTRGHANIILLFHISQHIHFIVIRSLLTSSIVLCSVRLRCFVLCNPHLNEHARES